MRTRLSAPPVALAVGVAMVENFGFGPWGG